MAEQLEEVLSGIALQGSFNIKRTKYDVSLTGTNLSWRKTLGKSGDEISIPIIDVVSVKTAASKSSKTGSVDSWILCYAERKKSTHLKKASIVFTGDQSDCQEWTKRVQQALDTSSQRPKRILAIVNPISGWSKGEKEYHSKVAPLFTEANITTDVIVTERANHSQEILANYDLSAIDCIVFVGGDGMYSEVVSGLMQRKVKESNIDLNEPNVDLPCIRIPIGIIPCGTGNVMAERMYGCKDLETAALSIIIGKRNSASIDSVSCQGEFVIFSVQSLGTGVWSDLVYRTEQNRQLGIFRFPLIMMNELLIKSPRPITYNIQYRSLGSGQSKDAHATQVDSTGDGVPKDKSSGSEWFTIEKEYIGVLSIDANIVANGEHHSLVDGSILICIMPCTRGQMLSFLRCLNKKDFSQPMDFIEKFITQEYKVKVVTPSDADTRNGLIERIVGIDGEPIELKESEFHVRNLSRRLCLFANVPEDFWIKKNTDLQNS